MSPDMSTDDGPLLIRQLIGRPSRRVSRTALRDFLDEITQRVARGRGVVCLITNDRELRRLNRQFLGKDYATDVLSFPEDNALPNGRGSRALHSVAPQGRSALPDGRPSEEQPRRLPALQANSLRHGTSEADQLGEIAISIDRAAAQAKEYGHSLADELRILMLHGALHLVGFDHEKDSGEMRRAEARWRKRFGLPLGLIERETARVIIPRRNGRARP
jgi:probable rRNA maturation factor